MLIPDGFIPWTQCILYYIILIVAVYFSIKLAKKHLSEERAGHVMLFVAGILIMLSINIPLPFGTTAHIIGGCLVAIVFGTPVVATLVFAAALLIQAFVFGNGGLTVLGVDVLNMGIIGGIVGLYTFNSLTNKVGKYQAIGLAAWFASVVSAIAATVELAIAGTLSIELGLYSMVLSYLFIGIIEAALTVAIIMALEKYTPDLLVWNRKSQSEEINAI